ncbi:MAG: hypothetical protein RIR70_1012 [Pseudomonadota bacterium]|jgi:methionyl-tRNA formyltransferase
MSTAVVFAYHNVGVRCLSVLLAHGVKVPLVVTHTDNPAENIWFESVAALAREHGIETLTPADPNTPALIEKIAALKPDFLFSFYYRHMLSPALLALASRGAWNMHGSLLPKYRGRVPVNWAIIEGERTTGATLHEMVEKPDAGGILAQQAVPILPNDTALQVFNKVTVAAEIALDSILPALQAGHAQAKAQDLSQGHYFGGRKPEDGRIDWSQPATRIHNLIRALAPPYPSAFCDINGKRLVLFSSRLASLHATPPKPTLFIHQGAIYAHCGGGGLLKILAAEVDGTPLHAANFATLFGSESVSLAHDHSLTQAASS